MSWSKIRRGVLYGGALIILLAFPYGPLFPWSPWKPGYEHLALQRADVYWPKGGVLPDAYRQFDDLIRETEQFEQIECTKRITVVECETWVQFRRLMPHITGRVLGAVTLATGAQIYVTPKLGEMKFDHREFLLHELGHALINQHQSILNAIRFVQVDWLAEGIAVANGRQKSYLSLGEVLTRAAREPVGPIIDPDRRGELKMLDMRLAYPVWRYFNEYLIAIHGREGYHQYVMAVAGDPPQWRALFSPVFGRSFVDEIDAFEESLPFAGR